VLLRRGAAKVYAVDTGYGALAWKLRQDERVVVMERTNALHVDPPPPEGAALVVIDLGWTKQDRAIPAALRWSPRQIITLIKPHYEANNPRLSEDESQLVLQRTLESMPAMGVRIVDHIPSPIIGAKGGNMEYLALIEPA
jgi:23S rRNA (cytidine1920-2'-O)/16S rRNA (cytidine1409-2'-O)-methyltransferase